MFDQNARRLDAPAAGRGVPRPGSGSRSSLGQRDLVGQTIDGKYLVRSVLGEGGMGAVFEAENLAIGRAVAVKVLHPSQAKKKVAVKRFQQEARAAAAIGHPNICEVHDLGMLEDGSPYLVMEKLVGETLADRIATEGGLPFEDVIDVLLQVLAALVAAHTMGIVHRDIKPENVFMAARTEGPPLAKLLDFGVSKMLPHAAGGEDLDLTRTGMVMGTPFYMSPEQARGNRNLDARVDLWACGVIMYEALTGRRPFVAANYNALLLQILTITPRTVRELRPALPAGFDEILDRAMARGRDDRYQSAGDFVRDLRALRDRHFAQRNRRAGDRSAPSVPSRPEPSALRSPRLEPVPMKPVHGQPPRGEPVPRGPREHDDPLAALPALGGLDDSLETQYETDPDGSDGGTPVAIPGHFDSQEIEVVSDRTSSTEVGHVFDEMPTEMNHMPLPVRITDETWDDETTPRSVEAAQYLSKLRRGQVSPPKPHTDVEQTVKIEGDIEAHFRQIAAIDKKKPRAPKR